MHTTWRLGVLPGGVENVVVLAGGHQATDAGALAAAADALHTAAARLGRREYRVTVGDTEIIVIPGLTEDGALDLTDLGDALEAVWPAAGDGGHDRY
ncbi:hypothetical protein [Pseudonocardia asaccharolytica]|uniref:Uncharacterized protein n=1 Tax=Pseudonocardia asaccharolytica DSM 44247 = NBRC 16224 TaxID=1123024 RepID=A0A511D983_9PSEU|nr:hypothetical protein [Pseudonocardia asaccharolytica]GEL20204.1 hypothetical protein PA7_40410 [Pseudonocardia asaccharolytica DSM 44247 = NBRC 16224]